MHENLWRSAGSPASYALVENGKALLFDAPGSAEVDPSSADGKAIVERVLLTHHHRHAISGAARFIRRGIPVYAPRQAAAWLTPLAVADYWDRCLPQTAKGREPQLHDRSFDTWRRSFNSWEYFVPAEGVEGIECTLEVGQTLEWRGWTIEVLGAAGHSRDQVAYAARHSGSSSVFLFAGDALLAPGKMPTPFTCDWDHWKGEGLSQAADSLRKLAGLRPTWVLPLHGRPFAGGEGQALLETAKKLEEAAFLKSFELFTKERLRSPPPARFLDQSQVATAGERPWSRLSEHLFLTGNTYVVASREGALWVVDPYGENLAARIRELQEKWSLGAVERVTVSHAHNDHYLGLYRLPDRDRFEVWTLDEVARPTSDPGFYCAPSLDQRRLRIDRVLKDGEVASWREYQLKIHHLPGQTRFTMGIEVEIDGKKCFLTGDNFFHADQFSGSGGWSGFNRGLPDGYARSAATVLGARPDWILAEHGGAFEFHEEDWRRRILWAQAAARAADLLCLSEDHRRDWNPHRLRIEPFILRARPDGEIPGEIVLENPGPEPESLVVHLEGRGLIPDQVFRVTAPPRETRRTNFSTRRLRDPRRRTVFALWAMGEKEREENQSDVFFILESSEQAPGPEGEAHRK